MLIDVEMKNCARSFGRKIAPELIAAIRSQHLLHHGSHHLHQRGVIGQHAADGSARRFDPRFS